MSVSEDLHQKSDVEFIEARKSDTSDTSRENSRLRFFITIYNFISGVLLLASLHLDLSFGKITKADLFVSDISVYCC